MVVVSRGLHIALWFEGKGNIGYGANIGSNHTGRLPDQECIAGEGVFFGLGCSVKYPCNLHNAPYSIIASGVTLRPQKVDMPFSLLNRPTECREGLSPAFTISCVFFTWCEFLIERDLPWMGAVCEFLYACPKRGEVPEEE